VQEVAKLLATQNPVALVKALRETNSAQVGEFELALEDLVITEVPKSGWMVSSHDGESVALDLALTPELIAAGNIREVIRAIQERRKSDGFDISDRIALRWNCAPEHVATLESGMAHICEEVLATSSVRDDSLALGEGELNLAIALKRNS
jgi:isoleucyl-tRNA synthetase